MQGSARTQELPEALIGEETRDSVKVEAATNKAFEDAFTTAYVGAVVGAVLFFALTPLHRKLRPRRGVAEAPSFASGD